MDKQIVLHIKGFINSFIAENRRDGWEHALISKPRRADDKFQKLEHHLDNDRCKLLEKPIIKLIDLGDKECLYWQRYGAPYITTISSVASLWTDEKHDAIVSIEIGKEAIILHHVSNTCANKS